MPLVAGLYYFQHGADQAVRPAVVLLHGAGGDHLYWPPQVRRLHDQRIFAPDLPGHGKSPGLGCEAVADYSAYVLQFLQALGLSRVVLVGHSMGAAIALDLGIRFPKRVLGLMLVGGGARLPVSAELLRTSSDSDTFPRAVKMLTRYSYGPRADPRLTELGAQRLAGARPAVLHGDLLACDAFDVLGQLAGVTAPTLVVCGSADRMTPPSLSAYLAQHIPGARLEIIPDVGHMLMSERPESFAEQLRLFIEALPYRLGE